MPQFDTAVLMGRFQPYHHGHAGLLRKTLETAPRVVVVLGSAFAAPTPRNPFSASERESMIRATLDQPTNQRVAFHHQRDVWDGTRWAALVRTAVESTAPGRTALVGYHKDSSSSYLDTFPDWTLIDAGRQGPLDATPLREQILSSSPWPEVEPGLQGNLHPAVLERLREWSGTPLRQELADDLAYLREYRTDWGKGPFLSVNTIVRALGHVLLVERRERPSRGAWAIPGGFLEPDERLLDGAQRKLRSETALSAGNRPTSREMIFSHPDRSQRARIVTYAFLYEPPWPELPAAHGPDTTDTARWIPQQDLAGMENRFFEDHFHILDRMLGVLPT